MKFILQIAVLLTFLWAGEFIVWLTGVPVPSSIIGMLLLAASLKAGIVKLRHIEDVSDFMVHNIALFFIPAGVGLMNSLGLIADQWLPIVGAVAGSTVVIIAVTGWAHKLTRRAMSRHNHSADRRQSTEPES